jgi:hypothetical protein
MHFWCIELALCADISMYKNDLELGPMAVGRTVIATGTEAQIFRVVYLVLRNLASDKLLPDAWKGAIPSPIAGPVGTVGLPAPVSVPPPGFDGMGMQGKGPGMMHGAHSYGQTARPIGASIQRVGPLFGGGFNPAAAGSQQYSQGPPPIQPYTATPAAQQHRNSGPAYARHEVMVPDMCVSYIIGKRGTLIAEIQQQSNANLEIAKVRVLEGSVKLIL